MGEVPECLNRRYKVLNGLIEDIITVMPACKGTPSSGGGGAEGGGSVGAEGGGGGAEGGGGCGRGAEGSSGGAVGGGCVGAGGSGGGGAESGRGGASGGGCGGTGGSGGRGAESGGGGSVCGSCGGGGGSGASANRGTGGGGCGCAGGSGSRGTEVGSVGAGGVTEGRSSGGAICVSCSSPPHASLAAEDSEVGIKLMCEFWKILQDDPNCNISQAVQQQMCLESCPGKCNQAAVLDKVLSRKSSSTGGSYWSRVKNLCQSCMNKETPPTYPKKHDCGASSTSKKDGSLRAALGNLKEAASYDKKCTDRLSELESVQKSLTEQISGLEQKEKKGVGLMKEADCMWGCMEESYKMKLAESQKRYRELQTQVKEVEASVNKWRKNKKNLEFQLQNIDKCYQDINEKKIQKENDVKVMQLEIEGFRKRIANNEKDLEAARNSYTSKKNASDERMEKIAEEMQKFQNAIGDECRCKTNKENEGTNSVKGERDELQKICRSLLQKKLENEDLRAEKEALLQEIGLLKNSYDTCAVRCAKREKNIMDETKRISDELAGFTAKCTKCHKSTDSADVMGFCVDCPRCAIERDCLKEGDHCSTNHTRDCVCTRIKEKFLDNVFENMYTVLEKQVKTCPGKELAECIFNCLKRSRNGKLDEPTRKIVQEFILSSVKKNLNLTIVGGAVKTRCEMEPDTYNQLMLCLKDVVVTSPPKKDKATPTRKPPCSRWQSTNECNCPKGPESCPCTKKAPKPPVYPGSCGQPETEMVDMSVKICPQAESGAYGLDRGMPGAAGLKREPCGGPTCPFASNMRAAQCVLGPDALADMRGSRPTPPIVPGKPLKRASQSERATCISGGKAVKSCHTDTKHMKGVKTDHFKEGTRTDYQETTNENLPLKLSLSDAALTQASVKPISSLQKAFLFTDEQDEKIVEELTKNNPNTKEQCQIAFKNENGQSNQQFTDLTQTPSGNLAIELDEQTTKIIEEKSVTDHNLLISIRTTSSGHVLVDFDTKENVIDKTHRVTVRRTSSGIKLDIHKNMIRILKDSLSDKIKNAGSSKRIKLLSSPKKIESPIDADTELLMSDKNSLLKGSTGTTYSDPDLTLKGFTGSTTTDNHLEHISSPILTEIYMKHKNKKKKKLTYPKTTPYADTFKLTRDTGLMLKNKKKVIAACSCDESNTSSVSCRIITEFDSPQVLEEQLISSWKLSNSRSVDNSNHISEFKQLHKQGNANVAIEIQVENGVVQKLPTVVTKTKSGTIALYARGMLSLQDIRFDGKQCPVFLSKTVSGTYFVRIASNYQNFNATLIKTPSEGILLIPQSFQEKYRNGQKVVGFFKVKLCVMENQILELPAVLQPTSSNNYLVVLDKEFEKCSKETLKKYFGDNLERSVDLRITSSGNYILELGNEDESHFEKKNALLAKTSSGHVKILVHDPLRKISTSSTSSAQASAQINSNLPASSREFHRENLKKSKKPDNPARTTSQSFVKEKKKLQNSAPSDKLHSKPSIVAKKTSSGQYAILLNEESKKSLLNNLSLTNNSEGIVPIKQLDSGEIIINNKDEGKAHGTLKVTPSGNFYVLVDEEVMKDLTEISTKNEVASSAVGTRSKNATQLIDSVHKAVSTTNQGKSDDCCCDTCVCADWLFDTTDGSNDKLVQLCPCVWKEASAGGVPITSTSKEDSDRIVFETSCNSTARKNEFGSTEQCFYRLGLSYPHSQLCNDYHQLLEKSEFCQQHENQPEKKGQFEANSEELTCQAWDALDYLPPQLPYFLKDVKYRV